MFWVPLAPLRDPELVLEAAGQALGAKDGLAEHIADKSLLLLFDNFEHVDRGRRRARRAARSLPQPAAARHQPGAAPPSGRAGVPGAAARARGRNRALPRPGACRRSRLRRDACRAGALRPAGAPPARARAGGGTRPRPLPRAAPRPALADGSTCSRQAAASTHASRRCGRRSSGATTCSTEDEQRLFARLAVFRGGCTLESAEEVCDADLDTLQSLVDKSLVRVREDDRFWMLETIREYAAERLEESGEADELRRRHAEHFLALAEEAEPYAREVDGNGSIASSRKHDNLRAALDWFEASGETQLVLRLAGALSRLLGSEGPPGRGAPAARGRARGRR